MIPDRRVRGDIDLAWSFTIPIVNRQRAPLRLLVSQHRLQGRPAFAFEAGAGLVVPGARWGGGSVEGGIETQARDHTDTGQPRHQGEPFQGRKTAVCHEDNLAARQPAPYELDDLPGAFQHGVMAAAALGIEALGGTEHRQKG